MYLQTKELTMKSINIIMLFTLSMFISGCGGSDESTDTRAGEDIEIDLLALVEDDNDSLDDAVVTVEDEIEEPVSDQLTEVDTDAIYSTTAELKVARSFLLAAEYELNVSYSDPSKDNVYLSLCSDFTQSEGVFTVEYDSCLVRASIENEFSTTLSVANDKTRLVMAIWDLNNPETPRYEVWESDGSENNNFIVN